MSFEVDSTQHTPEVGRTMTEEEFAKIRREALASLRHSARATLERKMRLGQYAVVIENGEVLEIGPQEIAKRLEKLVLPREHVSGDPC